MENNSLPDDVNPIEVLIQLKSELEALDGARVEIRDLGRTLIQQGSTDMKVQLDEYLRNEDDVLLRLAQMQVRMAQKEQERPSDLAIPSVEAVSWSDSGVYSYPQSAPSLQSEATPETSQHSITESSPKAVQEENKRAKKSPGTRESSASPAHSARGSPRRDVVPPCPPRQPEVSTGARQRTYADVAKSATPSPIRSPPPPPVSIKSDTQRNLELALQEWKQRLARLDHLIKTTNLSEPSVDTANEIVSSIFIFKLILYLMMLSFLGSDGCQLQIVSRFSPTSERPPFFRSI